MHKYIVIAVFLVMSVFLLVPFELDIAESQQGKKVTIAVAKTPLSAPFYVAQQLDLFDLQCVSPQIIDVVGGNRSFHYLVTHDADFGTSSDSVIVYQSTQRDDFVTLGSFVQSDNDIKLITSQSLDFSSATQEKPLKIATVQGTASEYFLSLFMAFKGILPEAVELIDLPTEQQVEALQQGKIDAIATWEPYAYAAKQQVATAQVVNSKNLYTLTFHLLSRKADLRENRQAAECILSALNQATEVINSNPTLAIEIVQKRLGLNEQVLAAIWQDYVFKLSLGQSLLMNLESQRQWRLGKATAEQAFTNYIAPQAMLAVNPAGVSIRLKEER